MDIGPLAERTGALQLELQRTATEGSELRVEVGGDIFGHLAQELQGDVQGLLRTPTRARQAILTGDEFLADVLRNSDGGEQSDHGKLPKVLMI